MARKRASMREGPLAELFRATEAAQRGQTEPEPDTAAQASDSTAVTAPPGSPVAPEARQKVDDAPTLVTGADIELDATVEHVYDFEVAAPEARTEPEARAEPDTPVDPGPAVAEVVELLPAPAIEPVAEPAAPVTEPPAEAVA